MILDNNERVGNHRGEFQFWPQVYQLWFSRAGTYGISVDFTLPYFTRLHPYHMDYYCSRRQ